jgi:hypothetical protein
MRWNFRKNEGAEDRQKPEEQRKISRRPFFWLLSVPVYPSMLFFRLYR